jgi:hypothetical protein
MERKQPEVDYLINHIEDVVEEAGERMQLSRPKLATSPLTGRNKTQGNEFSNLLRINKENILRGIIFSEILGSPLARRRR